MGPGIKGHTFTAPKIIQYLPTIAAAIPPLDTSHHTATQHKEGGTHFLGKYVKWGVPQSHPLYSPHIPPLIHPNSYTSTVPSMVSANVL